MAILALPFPRNFLYETFLLLHHCLSVLLLYSLWQYFATEDLNRTYLQVAIGLYGTLAAVRTVRLVWRTASRRSGMSRARIERCDDAVVMTVDLARPLDCRNLAGRYVYISTLGVSIFSIFQQHPFSIAWWSRSGKEAKSISLLIKPQRGYTGWLTYGPLEKSHPVVIDGPYGRHIDTTQYRSVILFATGIGIAGQLSIVKETVERFSSRRTSTTRVVLVWAIDQEGRFLGA